MKAKTIDEPRRAAGLRERLLDLIAKRQEASDKLDKLDDEIKRARAEQGAMEGWR